MSSPKDKIIQSLVAALEFIASYGYDDGDIWTHEDPAAVALGMVHRARETLELHKKYLERYNTIIRCKECKGSSKPTRKHSDLATVCEDCNGSGKGSKI